jgi:hypothetical protein
MAVINANTKISDLETLLDVYLYVSDKYKHLGIDYNYHELAEYKELSEGKS